MTRSSPDSAPVTRRRTRGPSPQKTELTRSEIVTAAIAEFMDVGITRATMDKIAKRANLAKGTLYLHFASKEELLLGALEVTFSESALSALSLPRHDGESMHAYISRLVTPPMVRFHQSVRADLARLVLGEAKRFPMLGQFYLERIFSPWHALVEQLYQRALDEGELQGILPSTAAMLTGSPFWVYLANDSMQGVVKAGCQPAELSQVQIDAIFGRYAPSPAK